MLQKENKSSLAIRNALEGKSYLVGKMKLKRGPPREQNSSEIEVKKNQILSSLAFDIL